MPERLDLDEDLEPLQPLTVVMNAIVLPAQLGKVIAQLENENDGIRLAAVAAATRILADAGLRWCEVSIVADVVCRPKTSSYKETSSSDWLSLAMACTQFPLYLNKWESEFISGLPRFTKFSMKQSAKLNAIVLRLRTCGCSI
jgi:hypothetical protein